MFALANDNNWFQLIIEQYCATWKMIKKEKQNKETLKSKRMDSTYIPVIATTVFGH